MVWRLSVAVENLPPPQRAQETNMRADNNARKRDDEPTNAVRRRSVFCAMIPRYLSIKSKLCCSYLDDDFAPVHFDELSEARK